MFYILLLISFINFILIVNPQDNIKLKKMYEEDQSSRKVEKIDWVKLSKEDSVRRIKVYKMIGQNMLSTANDYFYAAMIFQHGKDSTSYKLANDYSKKAAGMDTTNALFRWLSAASYDRYVLSIGKPQIYGTQFLIIKNKYYLSDFDTTKVTDAERIYYGTRTLKEIRDYLTTQNGEDNGLLIFPNPKK
ncbi:MAG: hypothetical protein V1773_01405 [bacterium]